MSTHITGQGARPRPGSWRAHRPGFGRRGQHLAASLSVCPPPATTMSCLHVYTHACMYMCMCVSACSYVCVYVFSDVRIHICTQAHIHMPHMSIPTCIKREHPLAPQSHILVYTHIHTCLCTSLSVYTHVCVHTRVSYMGAKTFMCTCVYMCVFVCVNIYIATRTCWRRSRTSSIKYTYT